jgi:hypothetical protein
MNDPFSDTEPWDPDQRRLVIIPPGLLALTPKAQQEKDYKSFDLNKLRKMSRKELAEWQAHFLLVPEAQIIAAHEWRIREGEPARDLTRRDLNLKVVAILVTIIGILATVIIGLLFRK